MEARRAQVKGRELVKVTARGCTGPVYPVSGPILDKIVRSIR